MFRLIILTLVPVLLVKLVASGHSSPSNPRGPNSRIVKNLTKIESSVSRLIRTQDLEEASSSRNAHEADSAVQKREAEKPREERVKTTHTQETANTEAKEVVDMTTGESRLELRLPSFKEAPPPSRRVGKNNERTGRARPVQRNTKINNHRLPPGPPPRQANRRNGNGYQEMEFTYDPRPEQRPPQNIYPIPIEFINQIPGAQQPFQDGSIRLEPNNYDFNPSAQIEQIVNGVPTVVDSEKTVDPYAGNFILDSQPPTKQTQFSLEGDFPQELREKNPTIRSHPVTSEGIFREEYPNPHQKVQVKPPYSQVPYHDSRLTTPSITRPTPSVQVAQDKVLHYMAPPNQALNYRVPPVIVDKTTPHPHRTTGLKTGYFPPSTRVMPRVSHIEAECRDDFMKLRVAFNDSFAGLIYSAGYTHDHDCMYINGTGTNTYEFYIQLNRCGTLGGSDHHKREVKNKTPTKNYMWNTVTIQYNPLIEEEWDEHFKVTCEYGYDFWKTVTFPFLEVDRSQLELSRTKRHFHY